MKQMKKGEDKVTAMIRPRDKKRSYLKAQSYGKKSKKKSKKTL